MEKLTDKKYWENAYNDRKIRTSLAVDGFSNYSNRLILSKLLGTGMKGKRILEIGAGDSMWLPYLANEFPTSQFVGLDYSEGGCALLAERARLAHASVEVVRADMLEESSQLHGTFDLAISLGVVEHFDDLGYILAVKKRYLRHDGLLFTLIPNLAGVLGTLVRMWNPEVYERHNPHDWISFLRGHQQAGLDVVSGGYLGSSNFGVLSSCFTERRGLSWQLSRALVATSLAIGWIEGKVGNLPSSKIFSPYMYAISR